MLEFPNVFVDRHFAYLLSQDLHSSKHSNNFVAQYITAHPGFEQLTMYCFQDIGRNRSVGFIVNTLGWKNFRDRLACAFIHYAQHRSFPLKTTPQLATELVDFDQQVFPYTTSGSSRGFLLALYLNLVKIHLVHNEEKELASQLIPPPNVLALLKRTKMKIIKIDWAILLLWHFADCFGVEQLAQYLVEGSDLQKLQSMLDEKKRRELYQNLLLYSYGIDDQDLFQAKIS